MPQPTILIAAGGTGGHLYPTIAIADEIKRQRPDIRIVFVGTHDRIEAREVPRAGYEFFPIQIEAPKKSLKSMITFPFKLSKAIMICIRMMWEDRPLAMLGGGAYLSVPAGIAAWAFHVPIAILEINSVAGTANKTLARIAQKLFIAYPESRTQFSTKIASEATVSGTPVRGDLGALALSSEDARRSFGLDPERKTILVFGGSLGARAINDAVHDIAGEASSRGYNVLWQTGKGNNFEALEKEFLNVPNVKVLEYIYEMEKAYRAADLVVCRAGASSLAELSRLGKPAVLVPYPFAAANHQEANAKAFESIGAAIVLRDKELKSTLAEKLWPLIDDRVRLQSMSEAMKGRDDQNAAKVVADWLISQVR